ncbi:lysophospholipid acyltransferase family protein [Hyphococcus sp.]|uniref:lysophospholipid acyltransferase family protein n=1 Tax=Hyphococcus sp. TaxID=2038636 RepID=UPI003CCBB416
MAETHLNSDALAPPLPERRADRPVKPVHYFELAAMRVLVFVFRLAGVDAASFIAGKFMRIAGPLIRPVSRRAENNLAMIFPDWPRRKIRAVTRDLWENLGRTAGEFAHLDAFATPPPNNRVEIDGMETLRAFAAGDKPAVFVSGHFANWEVIPTTLEHAGLDNAFVYRAANNPLTDDFIIHHRAKVMSRRQIPKDKRGTRALLATLAEGRALLMLVDQKLNTGASIPFLGKPAMTGTAAARLAVKNRAPIIYIGFERLRGAHFRMHVHEPVVLTLSDDPARDIENLTALINEKLGDDIRARPSQWLWFHRRWPKE